LVPIHKLAHYNMQVFQNPRHFLSQAFWIRDAEPVRSYSASFLSGLVKNCSFRRFVKISKSDYSLASCVCVCVCLSAWKSSAPTGYMWKEAVVTLIEGTVLSAWRAEENHENPIKYIRNPGRDLNRTPSEYKPKVLLSRQLDRFCQF
jgi:hypothetical protein